MQMSENKKVSVIIPVYNAQSIIKQCVEHVQKQTYENLEIICVNDGSIDNSRIILEQIAAEDDRIVVVNQENQGVSSARNKGVDTATGYYIQFVDSDDLIDFNMTEILVEAIELQNAQLAICGYRFSNGQPSRIPAPKVWNKHKFLEELHGFYVGGFVCSPWNKLFVRECIKGRFPEDMNLGEDAIFNLNYIMGIDKICTVDEAPYYYEVGSANSLSWRYNEKALYCEEHKNRYYMQCLQDVGLSEVAKKMMKEFLKDFKRCIDSEILLGPYSCKEMQVRIYKNITNPFWHQVLLENGCLCGLSDKELCKRIKGYVTKMIIFRYYQTVKSRMKKMIKG